MGQLGHKKQPTRKVLLWNHVTLLQCTPATCRVQDLVRDTPVQINPSRDGGKIDIISSVQLIGGGEKIKIVEEGAAEVFTKSYARRWR